MKRFLTPHNSVLIFALLLVCWSVYSFFSWCIKPLPDKIPDKIVNEINTKGFPGEPVFLSSQLMDDFVLNYPDLNIFPAGGEVLKNAENMKSLYVLEKYKTLKCSDISTDFAEKISASADGYLLKECVNGKGENSFNASSFIDKFKVTVFPSGRQIEFKRGVFKTGSSPWQKIESGSAKFSGKTIFAVSAHPLPEGNEIVIEIPQINRKASKMFIEYGIADSGKMKNSKPVDLKISQSEKEIILHSTDGVWTEHELEGFTSSEPIQVSLSTHDAGKRHFYFDIKYVAGEKE